MCDSSYGVASRTQGGHELVSVLELDQLEAAAQDFDASQLPHLQLVILNGALQGLATNLMLRAPRVCVLEAPICHEAVVPPDRRPIVL